MAVRDASGGPRLLALPLHSVLGVEIFGIDLAAHLGESSMRQLRARLDRDLVVVLRGQSLSLLEQIAFTARLGALARHPAPGLPLPEAPDALLQSEADAVRETEWHAHLSWAAAPNRYSALSLDGEGGVTEFASLRAAHARLDPWLQHRIEFLEVGHDHARRRAAGLEPAIHPLVRVDPVTGERSLMLDAGTAQRIVGVAAEESEALLAQLHAAATDPAITLRHHWQRGDLVLWDNRAVLHRCAATPRGKLRRTMVQGEPPVGPASLAMAWVSAG
jgi:taurine dioxygenase